MKKKNFCMILALSAISLIQAQQIRYCYNIGTVTATTNYGGIAGLLSGPSLIENGTLLYLNTLTGGNVYGDAKSDFDLKSSMSILNGSQTEAVWISDGNMINGGYPILSWQASITNIIEHSKKFLPKAYFNANTNSIKIEGAYNSDIRIFNMQGMICVRKKVLSDNFEMVADQLNAGCYMLVLNDGIELKTLKIIK